MGCRLLFCRICWCIDRFDQIWNLSFRTCFGNRLSRQYPSLHHFNKPSRKEWCYYFGAGNHFIPIFPSSFNFLQTSGMICSDLTIILPQTMRSRIVTSQKLKLNVLNIQSVWQRLYHIHIIKSSIISSRPIPHTRIVPWLMCTPCQGQF